MFQISKSSLRQVLTIIPVLLNEFLIGMGWGWAAPILSMVHAGQTDFTLTDDEESWMASVNELGRFFGPLLATLLLDTVGRKNTLIIVSLFQFLSCFGLIFAREVTLIYALRMAFGMSNGVNDVTSAIYLSENLTPKLRGIAGGLVTVCYYAGISFQYAIGAYLSYKTLGIVNVVISVIAICNQYYACETPYFLTMKGKYEKAEQNYVWLHGGEKEVSRNDLNQIKENADAERRKKSSVVSLLSASENVNSITIVLGVYLLTTATGYGPFTVYSTLIFESTDAFSADEFNVLFGVTEFLSILVSPFIVERFSRRTLIMVSFAACSLCNACTAAIFYLHGIDYHIPYHAWLIFALVALNASILAITYPVLYVIRGELFPLSIKAFGGCAAIMIQAFVSFITSKIFVSVANRFGMEANFVFYFCMCVLSVVYTFCLLPETRGKSLVDIQKTLNKL